MKEILWNQSDIGTMWILSVSFLVLLLLILIEFKKKRKNRLALRVVLLSLIIISLTLVILNPHFRSIESRFPAVLLGKHFKNSVLDSLKSIHQNRLKVISFNQTDSTLEAIPAVNLSQIAYDHPEIDTLFILGDAFHEYDVNFSYPFKIIPIFNTLPDGIIDIEIPHEISFHGEIIIKGKYKNDTNSSVLLLEDPQGIIDSTVVAQGISYFTLQGKPKSSGNFLYTIIEKKSNGTQTLALQVPITVSSFEALNIAIHLNSPSFEMKFLKNWLGSLGHQLALKSRISLNTFHKEIINGADKSLLEISQESLEDLDIIMIDGEVLRTLSNQKLQLLENAVIDNGLGVLILGNEAILKTRSELRLEFFLNFNLSKDNKKEVDYEEVINGKNIQGQIKKLPYQINTEGNVEILLNGLIAQRTDGLGKIGLLLISDSYSLNLSGKEDLYNDLWSEVISEMLPDYTFDPALRIKEILNFQNHQLDFQLLNFGNVPKTIVSNQNGDKYQVPMIKNPDNQTRWSGSFWPSESGWYQLTLENDPGVPNSNTEKWFFVQRDSVWHSLDLNKMNQQFMQFSTLNSSEVNNISPVLKAVEVDRIYFFAIFLLSCGLLWIEQKL